MREYIVGLQHFAAGDVVNYAGDGIGANAGTYNTNTNTAVSNGELAPEIKEFYDKALLVLAGPNLVHDQFGQKKPIPRGNGHTTNFRRFRKLKKAMTPLTEGVTPDGNNLVVTEIPATVDQYGDYIETTDRLNLEAIDNIKNETSKLLGDQAGLTMDTVVRNELVTGTNVMYAPSVSGSTETPITSRADITASCRLRMKDVALAAAELEAVNAPKINGSYVAIIHPYVATDLMTEAGTAWLDVHKYARPDAIFKGEIGSLYGVRFVKSTEAKIFGPGEINNGVTRLTAAEAVTSDDEVVVNETLVAGTYSTPIPVWVNGVANTITKVVVDGSTGVATVTLGSAVTISAGAMICGKGGGKDGSAVFCTLFLGQNAYGVTELEGGGLEYIAKPLGYGNDPLNQRSSQGWKGMKGAKILLDEYLIRYEHGSQFSANAEDN